MDCRTVLLLCMLAVLALHVTESYGRSKKVVIHVPYKLKKVKHTHTVYKTIHHHHTHHEPHAEHGAATEEHEHFHHMHIHNEPPSGQHSQPVPDIGIPEFLPDGALDVPLEIPDIPRGHPKKPSRHLLPLYRRN